MKISAIAIAIALASGAAMAEGPGKTTGSQAERPVMMSGDPQPSNGNGLVDKTKRGVKKAAQKTRNAFARLGDKMRGDEPSSDTRAMGAPGSQEDAGRRGRMDQAYENWKSRRQQ